MYKLLLIWRYFIKKRIALIAVLAIMMLVTMVLLVLSIMSGLLDQARRRNHDWAGDLILSRSSLVGFPYYDDFISRLDQSGLVDAATPVIKTYALIDGDASTELIGVRLNEFCRVTAFAHSLFYFRRRPEQPASFTIDPALGGYNNTADLTDQQRRRGCIVGRGLLNNRLGFNAPGGELRYLKWSFTVFALNSKGALTGSEVGDQQAFWNVDEFRTNLLDVDDAVLADFTEVQKLCWMDRHDNEPARTSEIRIRLKPGIDADSARNAITRLWQQFRGEISANPTRQRYASLLEDVHLQSWQQYRRDFIAPVENERTLMIVIFGLIAFVAVFIIFAIFYMIVTEKFKDIGIIKSLGGSRGALAQIFLGYGLLVGLIGAALGTTCGWALVTHSNQIEAWLVNNLHMEKLWNPEVYAIDRIPDIVHPEQALVIALVAVASSVAGAAIPARRAASLNVVEALRYE